MTDMEKRDGQTAFVFTELRVNIPDDLLPNIQREAADQGVSTDNFIRLALERKATSAIAAYLESLQE